MEMSMLCVTSVLETVAAMGYSEVIFTGGEPLLAENFLPATSAAHEFGLRVGAITNGSLLPRFMSDRDSCAGVQKWYISVDSPIADTHDAIRGLPCVHSIERALQLRPAGVDIVINTVLSRLSSADVLLLPEWMSAHGVSTINVIFMKHPSLALESGEAVALAAELLQLCHARGIRHHVTALPNGVPCDLAAECLQGPWLERCAVGNMCLFVEHDGRTFPCNCSSYQGEEACLGNICNGDPHTPVPEGHPSPAEGVRVPPFQFCKSRCDLSNRLFNHLQTTLCGAGTA